MPVTAAPVLAARQPALAPVFGTLTLFTGRMGSGKSTLALQNAFNRRQAGRPGVLLTIQDRAGEGIMSSRLGVAADAIEVHPEMDLVRLVTERVPAGGFVIADEAQFLSPAQVEQLAWAADELGVDIDCYAITTDFLSRLFPGAQRLVELADVIVPLQVEVTCWCGRPGRQNARIVDGRVARAGAQVAVGDTTETSAVSYRVLCRRHWRNGEPGPA
ncbi:thymidine kinase [Actinoplanes teichomyceticus]|uniref:Thymidine kinase n=1 Tax=Actinoplanes teichomyceticus TaxID=1867 RepID=A0A561WAH2_ACTTI|nr:thymidine kinase [Actinoplanes teichomyceticus]TWG20856.1 thymidine kinase [Actinoplanes teichomyceticus]GIF14517.1 thymidine kinase [Actinoplanes teichomyceticus]